MTTAQTMLRSPAGLAMHCAALVVAACLLAIGCVSRRPEPMPTALSAPYPTVREVVVAVAPFRNESGVGIIDELALTDTFVNEAQQTRGLSVLPVNRTLAGMRALRFGKISTQAEALSLAKALGADAVIVGTVHAWHPYDPPTIGLSVALFGVSETMDAKADPTLDPHDLRAAPSEPTTHEQSPAQPLSALSQVFDAASNETRALVRQYAEGRHEADSALGWERYTASMALYAKFACHEMTRRLLDLERRRINDSSARADAASVR